MKNSIYIFLLFLFHSFQIIAQSNTQHTGRTIEVLENDWLFSLEDTSFFEWEEVRVPHDWAINKPFDKQIDIQKIAVLEDGDTIPKLRTGRTGALPHVGVGWYKRKLNISKADKSKKVFLQFDGAMSNCKIFLNNYYVGGWNYGYSSFELDITPYIIHDKENILTVRLENKPFSSRWYPGAGLYREVRLVKTNNIYIKNWGTYVQTPQISATNGEIQIETLIENTISTKEKVKVLHEIMFRGEKVIEHIFDYKFELGTTEVYNKLNVPNPVLWSIESPALYELKTSILKGDKVLDEYTTTFGFRTIEFTSDKGFFLNGEPLKFKGVCLHHDLGPLGAAFNVSSMKHRLNLMKEMGVNAIRTAHNPPDPKLLDLADQMGFLVIDEAFDEWKIPKVENGYNVLWDDWAEKDLVAMIHRDRNHPSIIMWSIGNEVREQKDKEGGSRAQFLTDICHREDSTRPTTAGFNHANDAIKNGLADAIDIVGWNYKPQGYAKFHKENPKWKTYGSETASTVSSRGEYFFPAKEQKHKIRPSLHSNSFDMDIPSWGQTPDREFYYQDQNEFIMGEFVWTGFDYLGEPTPYNEEWPTKSSYFGIMDLCGIPKDRFYLYQSKWSDKKVLHLLPHWNWETGQEVSVHCYTNYDKVELFLNGKSLGVREKNNKTLYDTYRLRWNEIQFEKGELKAVALDENNNPITEIVKNTAGAPYQIEVNLDKSEIKADGSDLVFATISVLDKEGNLCPNADNLIQFEVEGSGIIKAVGNGDPTSLESFRGDTRKAFHGKCMGIIQSLESDGEIVINISADGLRSKKVSISSVSL